MGFTDAVCGRILEGRRMMLSRVANSVYWMGRYVERAENVARFIDVNHSLEIELGSTVNEQGVQQVIRGHEATLYFGGGSVELRQASPLTFFECENGRQTTATSMPCSLSAEGAPWPM